MPDGSTQETRALYEALGPVIRDALADPRTQDVMVNPDGRIWVRAAGAMRPAGMLDPESRRRVLAYAAHFAHRYVREDHARVSAILPGTRARLKGHIPPLTEAPCFTIRRPAPRLFTLGDYLRDGTLTARQAAFIEDVAGRRNLIIAGPPGSGKTTFANAVLALPGFADRRVVAAEDDAELVLPENSVRLLTDPHAHPPVRMSDLVQDALRMIPQVLLLGEVRGPEALDLIMAWNTGVGGLSTVHANSARDTLTRLAQLIAMNEGVVPSKAEIARAVHAIAFIAPRGGGRRLEALVTVEWEEETFRYDTIV